MKEAKDRFEQILELAQRLENRNPTFRPPMPGFR